MLHYVMWCIVIALVDTKEVDCVYFVFWLVGLLARLFVCCFLVGWFVSSLVCLFVFLVGWFVSSLVCLFFGWLVC